MNKDARYTQAMQEAGFRKQTRWVHEASYQAGRAAARQEESRTPPIGPDLDRKSWRLGYIDVLHETEPVRGVQ